MGAVNLAYVLLAWVFRHEINHGYAWIGRQVRHLCMTWRINRRVRRVQAVINR